MTLLDLVQDKNGFRKQSSSSWEGPCPKCGGTKRFIVWVHKDIFKCRECDFKGDLVKYLREVDDYSCREAFLSAGKECGSTNCTHFDRCKGNVSSRRATPLSATPRVLKADGWHPRIAESPTDTWQKMGQ